jgi:hypothetical protein
VAGVPRQRDSGSPALHPLTSAAVGVLLEKHQLNLDEEIQTYVPAFPRSSGP